MTQPTYCRLPDRPIVKFGLYYRIVDYVVKISIGKKFRPTAQPGEQNAGTSHPQKSPFKKHPGRTRETIQNIIL